MPDERSFLSRRAAILGGCSIVSLFAGCAALTDSDTSSDSPGTDATTPSPNTRTESTTDTATESPTAKPPEIRRFEFEVSPASLGMPPVWTAQHRIEDFQAGVVLEIAADEELGDVTLELNGEHWKEWEDPGQTFSSGEVVLNPNDLQEGQNTVHLQLRPEVIRQIDQEIRRTIVKNVPEAFKIDLRHGTNSQLRQEIEAAVENPEAYLSHAEDQVTDATTGYTSHDKLDFDKRKIDLAAVDFFHKNNFDFWKGERPQGGNWMIDFVETLDEPDVFTEPKKNPKSIEYVDGEGEFGSFDFEEDFKNATSLAEGHNELIRYISNFEKQVNDRGGMFSTRDEVYAALIQECFDRYNDTVDVHVWAFNIDFDGHGNGMMYDETNDSLYIMETVQDQGLDPTPVEESPYITGEHRWWHPVQFADGDYKGDFSTAKVEAAQMLKNIASIDGQEEQNGQVGNADSNFAITTDLVKQTSEALGEYNLPDTDWEFDNIRNVARTIEWSNRSDGDYVISADDSGDSIGANVYDITGYTEAHGQKDIIVDIWKDEERIYDDFDQVLMEFESGDHSTLKEAAQAVA